ncbi:hypothetical protein KI688_007815 [Linnemannia hyalina]|uniref:Uncharacterized protein n=1 Tax=Linnemannia hyalina TaxID=64524 RepID=A0A9P8BMA6_9FUNG|nr:hypothetical protein KI688_007815 [Linnemannia hyalina]
MLIGLYLEDLFCPPPRPGAPRPAVPVADISQQDQSILDSLCPRLSSAAPILRNLIGCKDQRRLAQADVIKDWLPFQTPGVLIQRLIAPVDPRTPDGNRLCGQQKEARHRGNRQELNSVKSKRYRNDVLPDRLLTTTSGTSDFLTELRIVFKTTADLKCLLGCTPDETDKGEAKVVTGIGMDDHCPWLKRRCETAAQPKDAPSSMKKASSIGSRAGRKRRAEEDGIAEKERGSKRTKTTMAQQKATTTKGKAAATK